MKKLNRPIVRLIKFIVLILFYSFRGGEEDIKVKKTVHEEIKTENACRVLKDETSIDLCLEITDYLEGWIKSENFKTTDLKLSDAVKVELKNPFENKLGDEEKNKRMKIFLELGIVHSKLGLKKSPTALDFNFEDDIDAPFYLALFNVFKKCSLKERFLENTRMKHYYRLYEINPFFMECYQISRQLQIVPNRIYQDLVFIELTQMLSKELL